MDRLLLIDHDLEVCELLRQFFATHKFCVDVVHRGAGGLAQVHQGKYDIVVLDIMSPEFDGLSMLTEMRRYTSVPIILLTARSAFEDRIAGLDAGADDYVLKPFDPRELLARVRAVVRRSRRMSASDTILDLSEYRLDLENRRVWKNGQTIKLTLSEFHIFATLMKSQGKPVSRTELVVGRHGQEPIPSRRASIDVHISNLRKKLNTNIRLIRTVRGVGYVLSVTSAAQQVTYSSSGTAYQ